jgi:folate-binding protein YgfZ
MSTTPFSQASDTVLQGALPLPEWRLLRAEGPDATSFLQGQLTQDLASLGSGEARLAGYCSAKGRLLASFVVWRLDADTLLLACSADLAATLLKRLSMFVLRAKCKLSDAGEARLLFGLAGPAATAWLGDAAPAAPWQLAQLGDAQVVRLPDADGTARYLWSAPGGTPVPALPALAADAWQWLEVRSGVPRITAATVEQFVPQMINLELLGGVSFKKGCYPGQEVVARSQYRGTLKRRGFLFEAAAAAVPAQEVFHSADPGQPAGLVVNAASYGGRHAALVELKIAARGGGSLHLGSADGALLQPQPMPYAVPLEAD